MYQQMMLFALMLMANLGLAQNRTIDGSNNNLQETTWGATEAQLNTITTPAFADGYSSPGGVDRPNPRVISNALFAQDSALFEPMNLSDYTWVFGQFIDHDVILVENDPTEPLNIPVDFHDVHFNPGGAFPDIMINMSRSAVHEGTGTGPGNPRGYTNRITAWIDASSVYGSDSLRAAYLRTFSEGKLKVSAGDLLPYNTDTYEVDGNIDPSAPHMENENPFNPYLMVAGDPRANENILLAGMHTLFVREHNRLCDELILAHPDWTDEELYQHARRLVIGLIQSVVYDEWLPALGVYLPDYAGYDDSVNPNISNVFSAAAFRLGHTLLNNVILRLDEDGNEIPEGHTTLADAFFNPQEISNAGGILPLFKGMAAQTAQELDCKIVDDVRNFLFGPPTAGLGGLDLASININRGRERGLPDFNTIRQDLGLAPYGSFLELNPDTVIATAMENLYGNINDIDPWVGMLAEKRMSDALFGEVIMEIMMQQFGALRDGDRFYYEIDPELSEADVDMIQTTTMRDIIMRNVGITVMQPNVFIADPDYDGCNGNPYEELAGSIITEGGDPVGQVTVNMFPEGDPDAGEVITTNSDGTFMFTDFSRCPGYDFTAEKSINHGNGLSTLDIIMIRQHILELDELDSPYQIIAADANRSGTVSGLDLVDLRKVVLFFTDTFPSNTSWRFLNADYVFTDPTDPFLDDFEDLRTFTGQPDIEADGYHLYGIKVGDVSGNADPSNLTNGGDERGATSLTLEVADRELLVGETYEIHISTQELERLRGMQMTLELDPGAVEFINLQGSGLQGLSDENYFWQPERQALTFSWDGTASEDLPAFSLNFRAQRNARLSDILGLSSRLTPAIAYDQTLAAIDIELAFLSPETEPTVDKVVLFQNQPNPFKASTSIRFYLPQAGQAQLRIYDAAGRAHWQVAGNYSAGYHEVDLQSAALGQSGIWYYELTTAEGRVTKRMVLVE